MTPLPPPRTAPDLRHHLSSSPPPLLLGRPTTGAGWSRTTGGGVYLSNKIGPIMGCGPVQRLSLTGLDELRRRSWKPSPASRSRKRHITPTPRRQPLPRVGRNETGATFSAGCLDYIRRRKAPEASRVTQFTVSIVLPSTNPARVRSPISSLVHT
jgi:hypothetical protein